MLFNSRALGNSLLTVQHYKDWKDRRRTYDASFSRKLVQVNCIYVINLLYVMLTIIAI